MPMRIKDDFKPTDKIFAVTGAWLNAVAKFINTFCVENGAGAYLRKPVSPSDNEPVALVFPEEAPVVADGTAATLGADQDQSATARATDWNVGDVDGGGAPAGVKVWRHRYYTVTNELFQVSWYELYASDGRLIKVSAEGTAVSIL